MNIRMIDKSLALALNETLGVVAEFLQSKNDATLPLVLSYEFEAKELSFEYMVVHSCGGDLLDKSNLDGFLAAGLKQAMLIASATFKKRKILLTVSVFEFEMEKNEDVDPTCAWDQVELVSCSDSEFYLNL